MKALENAQDRFLRLYESVRPNLRSFLHATVRDPHETDDLAQQVGVVLWRKFEQYDADRPFAGWAIGIARMELLKWRDRVARNRRIGSLSDEAISALADVAASSVVPVSDASGPDADEQAAALRVCIEKLSPAARQAVQMKYREGQQIRQIAAVQGREVAAVEMALVRARRALKQCIESILGRAQTP